MRTYQLPSPKDEFWRRTRPDSFYVPEKYDSTGLHWEKPANLPEGVHLWTWQEALRHLPSFETYFAQFPPEHDLERFIQDNAQAGWVLYVEPFKGENTTFLLPWRITGKESLFQTSIILDKGAKVRVVERVKDQQGNQGFFRSIIILEPQAQLTHCQEGRFLRPLYGSYKVLLKEDAHLTETFHHLLSSVMKGEFIHQLKGKGAHVDLFFADWVQGKGHGDYLFQTLHQAPHTFSRIHALGVVWDRGYSLHHGLLRVEKEAKDSDTYFSSRHLLMAEKGRADSLPKLEILTDEVKASHGVTVGYVDQEALFYLQTRGFTKEQAEGLLVEGFLYELYQRFPELEKEEEQLVAS